MSDKGNLRQCVVDRCPSKKKLQDAKVRYFLFPEVPVTEKEWIRILSLTGYTNEKCRIVCSMHFLDSDFETDFTGKFVLKSNAIPSVNLDLNLVGYSVVTACISNKNDTIRVGVLGRKTNKYNIFPNNPYANDVCLDFLNDLKNYFFNKQYKDFGALNDDSLENLIITTRKNQMGALKYLSNSSEGLSQNSKQRLYLYSQEDKNQTYAEIKTPCFGRCRLCLYCYKDSELIPLSARLAIDQPVTVKDYLTSLFPLRSDNFQPNHEICSVCCDNLLSTLHFFKMTLTVEGLLNTILKDQPFIFNDKEITVFKEEIIEENENISENSFNETTTFESAKEHNFKFAATKNSASSYSLQYSDEAIGTDSITNQFYEERDTINMLDEQQNDKVLTEMILIKTEDGCNDPENIELQDNLNEIIQINTDRKNDINLIDIPANNSLTDTSQYNSENVKYLNVSSDVNAGDSYIINNDYNKSDDSSRCESYSYNNLVYNEEDMKISVLEATLISELGNDENFCVLPQIQLTTPPVANPEEIKADLLKNLKVISMDSNVAKEKRIIFLGGVYCGVCQRSRAACSCAKLNKTKVMCEKCGKRFKANEIKTHATLCGDTPKKIFSCDKCKGTFSTKIKYECHMKKTADAPVCNYFKCKICSVKFSRTDFKQHVIEHPNFLCPNCGKSFTSNSDLYTHVKSHNHDPNREAKVVCQFCGKLISSKGNSLRLHFLRWHSGSKQQNESCDICNKKFCFQHDVRKHKDRVHSGKKYPCQICDKEFSSDSSLKKHYDVVHAKKPVKSCEICNKDFVRKDYYTVHMIRHHGWNIGKLPDYKKYQRKQKTIPSKCKVCKKTFKSRKLLGFHLRSDHPLRIKCQVCHLTFSNISNKDRHEKLHDNPHFQFSCRICFGRHKSENELQKHMKKSHSKKPNQIYQCYNCNETFQKKFLLMDHIGNLHTKNTPPTETMEEIDNSMN